MTEQPTKKATLYRKIAAVAGAIGRVEKDGYNPQLKYRYATPATIMEAVKPLLADRQIAIVPMVAEVIKEQTGGKTQSGAERVLTRVVMSYVILDGETGENLTCTWAGEGEDWSDKGIAKAQTIALRTFLINLFQIPSGDEDTDPDTQPGQRQPQRPATYEQPQKPPVKAAAAKLPDGAIAAGPKRIAALQTLWDKETELGIFTPAADLAIDLKDPEEATVDRVNALGKAAAARIEAAQERSV